MPSNEPPPPYSPIDLCSPSPPRHANSPLRSASRALHLPPPPSGSSYSSSSSFSDSALLSQPANLPFNKNPPTSHPTPPLRARNPNSTGPSVIQLQKQREREAKAKAKKEAAEAKNKRKLDIEQNSGRHANEELTVLMEGGLEKEVVGRLIVEGLGSLDPQISAHITASPLHGLVTFRRRLWCLGKATDEDCPDNKVVPFRAVVTSGDRFLDAMEAGEVEGWKDTSGGRTILVVIGALRAITRRLERARALGSPPAAGAPTGSAITTEADFQGALAGLLINSDVEHVDCRNDAEASEFVVDLAVRLAKEPYLDDLNELSCMKKQKKSSGDGGSVAGKGGDPRLKIAKDTWLRMLETIPGMSIQNACEVFRHYPTMESLQRAYDACSEEEGEALLEDKFGKRKKLTALSEKVYRILTAGGNGQEVLG
eukprot:CAMPEP_0182467010 /NCGR_PEP_ID=MMETSP1319-20130603/13079_1 /TAXON_ID=172717 /ORGANISM="Bolidomonas pacifica, Strain RCC208" /LENGTH=425 /DNA_ID=CAMNT_0024667059 /DNA_START=212 /DNA_END=1489 /DNA_ORIENTATION=-